MIAALFVEPRGVYSGLDGVDPWDEARDARQYRGPHAVVAHPPCQRWGRYWSGGPSAKVRRELGDDGGCFFAALWSVRTFGGVLEHPADSAAWLFFGLCPPPRNGWARVDSFGGWSCCVEQGHYGHRARKARWLYARGCELPSLCWGHSGGVRMDEGFHSSDERRQARARGVVALERLPLRERLGTPIPFRDLLLSMAKTGRP